MAELPAAGQGRVQSMSRNGTAITYAAISSAFTDGDEADLRSLCGQASTDAARGALPVGSFPEGGEVAVVWPEGQYS